MAYGLSCGAVLRAQRASEAQIEAAYIFNFIHLTNWPAAALGAPSTPFRICAVAGDDFVEPLERTVAHESLRGHPLAVERVATTADPRQCQVLFIARDAPPASLALVRGVRSAAVLTVGGAGAFFQNGGMIAFVVDQDHVRFDVNRQEAGKHGLTFSSKLLRVARTVR